MNILVNTITTLCKKHVEDVKGDVPVANFCVDLIKAFATASDEDLDEFAVYVIDIMGEK